MHTASTHLSFLIPLLVFTLGVACFAPVGRKGWRVTFDLLILLSIVVGRWPAIFAGRLANPDESQIIAGAATLWRHPEFWKWVDGMTVGPVSYYTIWLGKLAGFGFTYEGARMIAAVFFATSVIVLRRFLADRFPELPSRVSVVPFVVFGSLDLFWDMVQFGNETTPLFFLCVGLWLAFPADDRPGRLLWRMFAAGFALGAVPFAKLQVAPMAVLVGVTAVVVAIRRADKQERWSRAAALSVGAFTIPVATAIYLTIYNLWHHFFITYLANNITYIQNGQNLPLELLRRFFIYLLPSDGTLQLFIGTLLVLATCVWLIPSFSKQARNWTLWSVVWLCIAVASIVTPGRAFEHYQNIMIPALLLTCGTCLCGLFSLERPPARSFVMIAVFLSLTTLPLAARRLQTHQASLAGLVHPVDEFEPVTKEVLKYAGPGEMMAIWGWVPNLWVSTGLIQGTRDGISIKQIDRIPERAYYRGRYIFDINRNTPPVFLDASGPGRFAFNPRSTFGHETFPELKKFVAENYVLRADLAGVRVYVRKDRASVQNDPAKGG